MMGIIDLAKELKKRMITIIDTNQLVFTLHNTPEILCNIEIPVYENAGENFRQFQ